ncbi:MAG: HAMP domain-containing histidine kinase, partial [Oscillospiraceae bacterium]|nr:HAMP domain-containing histidine kinase [Oscillospiraceae bacterium]
MNSNYQNEEDKRVKKKIMRWRETAITYSTILLLVGIQSGIVVLPAFNKLHSFIQVTIIMGYWAVLALAFTYITNWQIKQRYDKPMRKLSAAAKKVADGDFSVYIEPNHTPDNYDYIDVMFLDFNTMVQELNTIETLKNDFVSNVSHEIKTPLAVIKNYTSSLRSKNLSEDIREEYIDTIVKATDNLSALVSNILKLNKLENQEIESAAESYDLCRQLTDCALQFESLWEQKNIEFIVDIEDRATVQADKDMLEIVWNNLLSNALKFTNPGGEVTLKQTSDANTITVSVSDTGCGMNEQTIKRIFDKFYQGDTSHSGEGNGLGLALAYRVMEKLGGSLTVVSEPG